MPIGDALPTKDEPRQALTVTIPRASGEMSVAEITAQTRKIQEAMAAVMIEGEHYGVIPGVGKRKDADGRELPPKKSLYKPGAEKLCLLFRLAPEYEIVSATETADLIRFTIRCTLIHFPTGQRIATGLGSCNSREEKYRRPAPKKCPECEQPTIFRSKRGSGFYCWAKKGGCGVQFESPTEIEAIESQESGLADPADLHNTILKMACKRALIAGVLNGTAASDCFAQDLEDLPEALLATDAPEVGANIPAPRKGGLGAWPKAPYEHPSTRDAREIDDQYRATVGATGMAPSQLEVELQKSIDENTIEVYNPQTGEFVREPKMTAPQHRKIRGMLGVLQIGDDAFHAGLWKYYKIRSSTLLTKAQANDTIERLNGTAARGRAAGMSIPNDPQEAT